MPQAWRRVRNTIEQGLILGWAKSTNQKFYNFPAVRLVARWMSKASGVCGGQETVCLKDRNSFSKSFKPGVGNLFIFRIG